VDSLEAAVGAAAGSAEVPVGLVLDTSSFYAESGGQVGQA
jgi:alanyl-tRNA synthetase